MRLNLLLYALILISLANITYSNSDMTVDGPIMALTSFNDKRLVDVVSLTSDRKCITIQANKGPIRLPSGRPASTDVTLNSDSYPSICPRDSVASLVQNLVIIQIKALDFSRNGHIDLLVSLAPDNYKIDRSNKQVVNLLYLQVGEERSKYSMDTLTTLFSGEAIDFYEPIVLISTAEPLTPLMINSDLYAPDLVYAADNTTLRVLINRLADYTAGADGQIPLSRCLSDHKTLSNCFEDAVLYEESMSATPGLNISIPLDISQVDLSGNCKPELALKMDVECLTISQNAVFADQISKLSAVSLSVLNQHLPYGQGDICSIVQVFTLDYSSTSSITRYIPSPEHAIFLGVGVGMLTFADINNNAAMDIVFAVCRGRDASECLLENSVHVLHNKQMYVCNSPSSTQGLCRGKTDLCLDDPDYAFNSRELDIVIYPLPSVKDSGGEDAIPLTANTAVSQFDVPRVAAIDYRLQRKLSLVVPVKAHGEGMLVVLDLEPCSGDAGRIMEAWESGRDAELLRLQQDVRDAAKHCPDYLQVSSIADFRVYPSYLDAGLLDVENTRGAYLGDFVDFVGNGHATLVVNIPSTSVFLQPSLPQQITGFFLKVDALNDLCLDACRSASPRWARPYYSTAAPGVSFKYVTSDISAVPAAGAGSQFCTMAANPLVLPYTFWGISDVAQYIDVLFAGNIYADGGNCMYWSGIVPNSYVTITQYPPDSASRWILSSFLPDVRGTEAFVIVFALGTFAILLLVTVTLHCCELKRDKQLERQYSHSLYRSEL